MHNDK
jgi:hypothetical protein